MYEPLTTCPALPLGGGSHTVVPYIQCGFPAILRNTNVSFPDTTAEVPLSCLVVAPWMLLDRNCKPSSEMLLRDFKTSYSKETLSFTTYPYHGNLISGYLAAAQSWEMEAYSLVALAVAPSIARLTCRPCSCDFKRRLKHWGERVDYFRRLVIGSKRNSTYSQRRD